MKTVALLLAAIVLVSCKKTEPKIQSTPDVVYKDTLIHLAATSFEDDGNRLDSVTARTVLHTHFKNKGYLIESELDLATYNQESPENYGKKAIDYIGIHKFRFKNKPVAVIRYYSCEPFENGNCVEANYAIIANTKSGYKITDEAFLSPHFRIDSIKNNTRDALIFGYYFECANKKILKHYRVTLQ